AVLGLANVRRFAIGAIDREVHNELPSIVRALRAIADEIRPRTVLTHAYEGGHPDHDATAFAVRAAMPGVELTEFAGYHAGGLDLLPRPGAIEIRRLTEAELARRDRALACFVSQAPILESLRRARECVRTAPREDFGKPPHEGPLFYERHGWGID